MRKNMCARMREQHVAPKVLADKHTRIYTRMYGCIYIYVERTQISKLVCRLLMMMMMMNVLCCQHTPNHDTIGHHQSGLEIMQATLQHYIASVGIGVGVGVSGGDGGGGGNIIRSKANADAPKRLRCTQKNKAQQAKWEVEATES